jgi:hypothetical protein
VFRQLSYFCVLMRAVWKAELTVWLPWSELPWGMEKHGLNASSSHEFLSVTERISAIFNNLSRVCCLRKNIQQKQRSLYTQLFFVLCIYRASNRVSCISEILSLYIHTYIFICVLIYRFYSFATRNLQKDRKLKPYPLNQIHASNLEMAFAIFK